MTKETEKVWGLFWF